MRLLLPRVPGMTSHGKQVRLLALGAAVLIAASGCGAPSASSAAPSAPNHSAAAGAVLGASGRVISAPGQPVALAFDPANFVDPRLDTNPFHPLKPGLQWIRSGTTEVGRRVVPHQIITTMTDVIRVIDGVPTIAMLDQSTDSGEISQVGMDYLALDKDGNVWILGGYTEDYSGGAYTNAEVAYLGTGKGQSRGILSPAHVDMTTPVWLIGAASKEAASIGRPVKVGVHECVKFGCYDNVRVVLEGNVGAPDNENKSYAPGVGVINNVPLDKSLHKDSFQLVNFTELSPAGLSEASRTLLDLEAHARITSPKVFGPAPKAKRAS